MPTALPTDEIYERYLKKAIAEINELGDELARTGDELRVPVVGSGHPLADVLLLKYLPLPPEIQEGVAFFGRSGQAVLKSLQRLHVDPLAVYGTNCLKFGTEDPADAAAWLTREIHIVQPKLIVVMGERSVVFVNDLRFPLSDALDANALGRAAALHADDRGAGDARHRRVARRPVREDRVLERLQGARPLVVGAASVLSLSGAARSRSAPSSPCSSSSARARRSLPGLSRGRRDRLREPRRPARVRGRHLVGASVGAGARVVPARSRRRLRARLGRLLPSSTSMSSRTSAKLVSYILFGFWFLSLFEALWWLALVALLVPWVDIWSVAAGPTEYVTEERPEVFDGISVALHVPGETSTANIGPPDIVFFALFLAAAQQFRLRVALTWISMTAFLSLTLLLVYFWDTDGLPALPAVCWGFLLPNARPPLARRARRLRRARAGSQVTPCHTAAFSSSDTDSTCGVCGNMSTGRQRTSS